MRGKPVQYNAADGSGTLVAEGRQYRFALTRWRGDSAPAINKTLEFVTIDPRGNQVGSGMGDMASIPVRQVCAK